MRTQNSAVSATREGNTKPLSKQVDVSLYWCFTYNNYEQKEIEQLSSAFSAECKEYIFGEEIGESGTKHLQGYIQFKKRNRPSSLKLSPKIHWEKCKGTRKQNIDYCTKDGKIHTNIRLPKPIKLLDITKLYGWQDAMLKVACEEPDDRTIYWIYDEKGNKGKSAFTKLLCAKYNAIMCEGKAADINQALAGYNEAEGVFPDIVCVDCPRHCLEYMNYGAIEKVKNGHVFSGKYESKQMIFNPPHVFIFANSPPDTSKYSLDRWKIKEIHENKDFIREEDKIFNEAIKKRGLTVWFD